MEEAVFVHVGQSEKCLIHNGLDIVLREVASAFLHQLINILLHVFKNEIEIVIDSDDLLKFDDVHLIQFSERFDFTKRHALLPTIELLFHLLDSYGLI